MAYFPDLTPYAYYISPRGSGVIDLAYPNALNVGWLDRAEPFPVDPAALPAALLNRLLAHTVLYVLMMRGFHRCHFCSRDDDDWSRLSIVREGREIFLDNGEVLVVGADGSAFRAPAMLYHYITVHGYRPPDVFLKALGESSAIIGSELEESGWAVSNPKFLKKRLVGAAERREFALRLMSGVP